MTDKNVPKLRYPGFSDPWKNTTLGEFLSIPEKEKESEANLQNILTVKLNLGGVVSGMARETLSLGKTIYYKRRAGQFIYGKQNFFNGAIGIVPEKLDGMLSSGDVPALDINNVNADFLYRYISRESYYKSKEADATGTGSKRIHETTLCSFEGNFPSIPEQEKIGNFFKKIDKLIEIHKNKSESISLLKKSLLQRMFPRAGADVPELRYPGYTYAWESRLLGEILIANLKPVEKPKSSYTRLGLRSHMKGTFHEFVEEEKGLAVDTMYEVEENNLILSITFAWEMAIAITNENDKGKLVSHRFPQYKFKENYCPHFFYYSIDNKRFRESMILASPGGAGRNRVLKKSDFLNISKKFPNSAEQQKISTLFRKLDRLIEGNKKMSDHYQQLKKALLQQMFV